jgi:hypothetical protein
MLKVTNLGRAASIDIRLVDPTAPDDPNSKINRCVRNTKDYYDRFGEHKATQLIFLDMGVPKRGDTASRGEDEKEEETTGAPTDEAETARMEQSLYADLKQKLIASGIPENEIAFIHDYPKDDGKMELFDRMNDGDIRVLIGSTGKMGTGMNAQKRIIAIHQLDAPWKPADVEQRDGRGLRPGNMFAPDIVNGERVGGTPIHLVRYLTKDTFDEYIWQTLEHKAQFVAQARSGDLNTRTIEELGPVTVDYATSRALSSKNPLIKEQADVQNELGRLSMLLSRQVKDRSSNQYQAVSAQRRADGLAKDIARHQAAHQHYQRNTPEKFEMQIGGQTFTKQEDAGGELLRLANKYQAQDMREENPQPKKIGSFAGFEIYTQPIATGYGKYIDQSTEMGRKLARQTMAPGFLVSTPDGSAAWEVPVSDSKSGQTTMIRNTVARLPQTIEKMERERETETKKATDFRAEAAKPFPYEERMKELQRRANEIDAALLTVKSGAGAAADETVATGAEPNGPANFDDPGGHDSGSAPATGRRAGRGTIAADLRRDRRSCRKPCARDEGSGGRSKPAGGARLDGIAERGAGEGVAMPRGHPPLPADARRTAQLAIGTEGAARLDGVIQAGVENAGLDARGCCGSRGGAERHPMEFAAFRGSIPRAIHAARCQKRVCGEL